MTGWSRAESGGSGQGWVGCGRVGQGWVGQIVEGSQGPWLTNEPENHLSQTPVDFPATAGCGTGKAQLISSCPLPAGEKPRKVHSVQAQPLFQGLCVVSTGFPSLHSRARQPAAAGTGLWRGQTE